MKGIEMISEEWKAKIKKYAAMAGAITVAGCGCMFAFSMKMDAAAEERSVPLGEMEIFYDDTYDISLASTAISDKYLEDNYGNVYDHSFYMGRGSVIYLTNYEYDTFSGTVAFPKEGQYAGTDRWVTLMIYGDDVELATFEQFNNLSQTNEGEWLGEEDEGTDDWDDSDTDMETISEEQIQMMRDGIIQELGETFWLDLDGDGEEEYVELAPMQYQDIDFDGYQYCSEYELYAGRDSIYAEFQTMTRCTIYGVSLDENEILLIVYALGPNDDPSCTFYHYENGELWEIGAIEDSVDNLEIDNGVISGRERTNIMDTSYCYKEWKLDGDSYLIQIPQDYYIMENYSIAGGTADEYYATLKQTLELYEEMDFGSESIILEPQKVAFPYTDDAEWVYVQGESGDGGWLWMGDMEETSEKEEYFDGLFFCD